MTIEEFKNLQVGEYFYNDNLKVEWIVLEIEDNDDLHCECTKGEDSFDNEEENWVIGDNQTWGIEDACYFALGRHPDNVKTVPTPEQPQQMTVAEALKNYGLKVGNKIWLEFEVISLEDICALLKTFDNNRSLGFGISFNSEIRYEPPFIPKHNDICTVLTKQGLATKCKVYEHEGELYAIALKDDKPDGTFNPSQIEKFLPL